MTSKFSQEPITKLLVNQKTPNKDIYRSSARIRFVSPSSTPFEDPYSVCSKGKKYLSYNMVFD